MQSLQCRFHPDAVLLEDYRAGDVICSLCGLVVGERIVDVSSEWRHFSDDSDSKNMSRVGATQSFLFDNNNLETVLSGGPRKHAMSDSHTPSGDAALKTGYDAVRAMAHRLFLNKRVIERACLFYKHCHENKLLHGRSRETVVTACLYLACKQESSPQTLKEICDVAGIPIKGINRLCSKVKTTVSQPNTASYTSADLLVPRFLNQLELDGQPLLRKTAIHVAKRALEVSNVQGRAPRSIAAAVIFLVCSALNINMSKKELEQKLNVSEAVIRGVYAILRRDAGQLFPADFVSKRPLASLAKN